MLNIHLLRTYLTTYCYTNIRLKDRVDFILWCCEFHNYINDKLGKDQYTCDIASLEERWKYGSPACGYDTPPLASSADSPTTSSSLPSSSSLTDSSLNDSGDNSNNNNGNAPVAVDRSEGESDCDAPGDAQGPDLNQDLTLPYSQDGEKDVVEGAEPEEALQTPDPLIIITLKGTKGSGSGSDAITST